MLSSHNVKDAPSPSRQAEFNSPSRLRKKEQYIKAQQIELLYTQAPTAFVGTTVNVGIATVMLWQVVDHRTLFSWVALILAITLPTRKAPEQTDTNLALDSQP